MIALILVLAAAGFAPAQGNLAPHQPPQASPPPHPPSNGGGERWGFVDQSHPEVNLAYEREATALKAEMHALEEADGGKLTAQHRAYLRDKAKALVSAYNRDIRLVDPIAVNADGSKKD